MRPHPPAAPALPFALGPLLAAALLGPAAAQCEVSVLVDAGGPTFGSDYGRAVGLSNGRLMHGPGQDVSGVASGRVVARRWDGSAWVFDQTIFPSSIAAGDRFGNGIHLAGDLAIVGATGRDEGAPNAGSAWVWRHDGTAWVEEVQFLPPQPEADGDFGRGVAVQGDLAVVGEPGSGPGDEGAVHVFERTGAAWSHLQTITRPSSPSGNFGWAVALDGDRLAVGAELEGGLVGRVDLFERTGGAGTGFAHVTSLTASDGYAGDLFGAAVDLRGDRLLVGAPASTPFSGFVGAAYLFEYDGSSWTEVAKLQDPSVGVSHWHGSSVALGDGVAVVGTPLGDSPFVDDSGAVSLWRLEGSTWRFDETFGRSQAEPFERFGEALAVDGDWLAVGAPWVDTPASQAGVTLLYSLGCDVDRLPPCGGNPPKSIQHLAGRPSLGLSVTLGVTNSEFTQSPGAFTVLMLSSAPAPGGTCGTPLPGWSMYGPLLDADLRIAVAPPDPFTVLFGGPWAGFGQPTPFALQVPANPTLVGARVYAQGALIDLSSTLAPFAATEALRLTVGP